MLDAQLLSRARARKRDGAPRGRVWLLPPLTPPGSSEAPEAPMERGGTFTAEGPRLPWLRLGLGLGLELG